MSHIVEFTAPMRDIDYDDSLDDGEDDRDGGGCIHISYTEEAGGWLICDDCGEDVTLEIERGKRMSHPAKTVTG